MMVYYIGRIHITISKLKTKYSDAQCDKFMYSPLNKYFTCTLEVVAYLLDMWFSLHVLIMSISII
jgi:hypothetical protein